MALLPVIQFRFGYLYLSSMSVRWRTFWAARDPGRGPPGVVGRGPPLMAGAANPPAARAENPPAVGAENPPAAGAENPPAAGAENPPAVGAAGRIDGACRRGTPGVSGAARYKTNACEGFL